MALLIFFSLKNGPIVAGPPRRKAQAANTAFRMAATRPEDIDSKPFRFGSVLLSACGDRPHRNQSAYDLLSSLDLGDGDFVPVDICYFATVNPMYTGSERK